MNWTDFGLIKEQTRTNLISNWIIRAKLSDRGSLQILSRESAGGWYWRIDGYNRFTLRVYFVSWFNFICYCCRSCLFSTMLLPSLVYIGRFLGGDRLLAGILFGGRSKSCCFPVDHKFIISLLSPLLGHRLSSWSLHPPTLIPLSGVGTTCFSSCCDKDSEIIFTTCLTSTVLETGVGANDCKCNRDQRLNVPSEARRSSR
jgi:hypothetical protein